MRAAVGARVAASTNADGRIEEVYADGEHDEGLPTWSAARVHGAQGWGFAGCNEAELGDLFGYLEEGLRRVVADNELGAIGALDGEYVLPGLSGDPICNPDVLPTGKNMHALDPQ